MTSIRTIVIAALILCSSLLHSQAAKFWNIPLALKEKKVEEVHKYTLRTHEDGRIDSCLNEVATIDQEGKLLAHQSFRACGKMYAEQWFEYDDAGKLLESCISHVNIGFSSRPFIHEFEDGLLISRELENPIPGFWQKETYKYDEQGRIKLIEQWNFLNDRWMRRESIPVKVGDARKKNTMSYVYDEAGLMLVHNIYIGKDIERIEKFFYSFR